jgi:hypothetical protein
VASRKHILKPPRMFRPADASKLVEGAKPVQRRKEECTGKAEGTPCGATGRNSALPASSSLAVALGGWSARAFRPDSNQTMTSARQDAEQRLKGGPCRCDRYHVGSPPQR